MAEYTGATSRALKKIDRLNLKKIVARTAKEYRWTERRADSAELWYRNFLKLCYLNRRQPVAALGKDADLLWHQHILHTVSYQRDCKAIFGRYLNHVPIEGRLTPAERKAMELTRKLYLKEFGALPSKIAKACVNIPPPRPGPPPH